MYESFKYSSFCIVQAQTCLCQLLVRMPTLKAKTKKVLNCLIENCNAQMLTGQGSSYNRFSQKTKQKYNQVLKILNFQNKILQGNIVRNCRAVNCNGYINLKTGKCILCEAQHCLDCLQIHSRASLCDDLRISFFANGMNFKRCKVCKNGIQKIEGCAKIRCNNCNHLFCYQCQQPWSAYHHICQGTSILMLPYYYFIQACLKKPQSQRNFQKLR